MMTDCNESQGYFEEVVWYAYINPVGPRKQYCIAQVKRHQSAQTPPSRWGLFRVSRGVVVTHSPERIFNVRPAYDCIGVQPCVHGSDRCKPGTGGSHGRHNAELHMTVRGPDAEITLVIGTGWDLPTVPEHHRRTDKPCGRFVEFHTAHPRYEGQDGGGPMPDGTCRDWAGCYLDTGYSMSDEPTRLLVEKGSDAAWEWLEALYNTTLADMKASR